MGVFSAFRKDLSIRTAEANGVGRKSMAGLGKYHVWERERRTPINGGADRAAKFFVFFFGSAWEAERIR